MEGHILTGFGFGPIGAGLFVNEAYQSNNFQRIAIAEIDQELVDAVRSKNGSYFVNVAKSSGVEVLKVEGIEIFNPNVEQDRGLLAEVLSESTEIVTCLPSVSLYDTGENGTASLIARGLSQSSSAATIIYTAENNNRAAEILEEKVRRKLTSPPARPVQYLNTVIGKMSQVVTDPQVIDDENLVTIAPSIDRAFLVEEFNKILVTKCTIANLRPGVQVFLEKEALLPFEEAKLYGHNAIHALLAYLGSYRGYAHMRELKSDPAVMQIARDAFIDESGAALIKKYDHLGDELFTEAGYQYYAEDLLRRMTNPYLADTIERAGRDPVRKLGLNDRIFGTMALALDQGIPPRNIALCAAAGIVFLLKRAEMYEVPTQLRGDANDMSVQIERILNWIWRGQTCPRSSQMIRHVQTAYGRLVAIPRMW
ncbi:MAG: mannitol dehydrogenase family protein [Planctomycetota bacterium]|jgi:mannitol-1-phosphate 5-dehydrogenase